MCSSVWVTDTLLLLHIYENVIVTVFLRSNVKSLEHVVDVTCFRQIVLHLLAQVFSFGLFIPVGKIWQSRIVLYFFQSFRMFLTDTECVFVT